MIFFPNRLFLEAGSFRSKVKGVIILTIKRKNRKRLKVRVSAKNYYANTFVKKGGKVGRTKNSVKPFLGCATYSYSIPPQKGTLL